MNNDPAMHEPCWYVRNRISLLEHGNGHVEIRRVKTECLHQVLPKSPSALLVAPCAGQRAFAQGRRRHRLRLRLFRHVVVESLLSLGEE